MSVRKRAAIRALIAHAKERASHRAAAEAQLAHRRLQAAFMNLRRAAHFAAEMRREHEASVQRFRERRALRLLRQVRDRVRASQDAAAARRLLAIRFRAWRDTAHRQVLRTAVVARELAQRRALDAWTAALRTNRTRRAFHAFRDAVQWHRERRKEAMRVERLRVAAAINETHQRIGQELMPTMFLYCVARFHTRCLWEDLVSCAACLNGDAMLAARRTLGMCNDMVALTSWSRPVHQGLLAPLLFHNALVHIIAAIAEAALSAPRITPSTDTFDDETSVFVQIPIVMAQSLALMSTAMENVYAVVTRECGPEYGRRRARWLLEHYAVPVHVACTREHVRSAEFLREVELPDAMQNLLPFAMKAMADMQRVRDESSTASAHVHCLESFCERQGVRCVAPVRSFRPEICLRIRPLSKTPDNPAEPNVPGWLRAIFDAITSASSAAQKQVVDSPRTAMRRRLRDLRKARK